MTSSRNFGPGLERGAEGILVFATARALLGPAASAEDVFTSAEQTLALVERSVRALVAARIEVVVLSTGGLEERRLVELVGAHPVELPGAAVTLSALARLAGVPYWRTAAVGDALEDLPLLDAASLPFWLSAAQYSGERGVVQLDAGDIATLTQRLLDAWLPQIPRPERRGARSTLDGHP